MPPPPLLSVSHYPPPEPARLAGWCVCHPASGYETASELREHEEDQRRKVLYRFRCRCVCGSWGKDRLQHLQGLTGGTNSWCERGLTVLWWGFSDLRSPTAAERRRNTLTDFKDFYLQANARIWFGLSGMRRILRILVYLVIYDSG